jgi:branched-chain amino acid transport system permease protein
MYDLPAGVFTESYREETVVARTKSRKVLLLLFLFFIYIVPPLIGNDYLLNVMINIIIWIIAAQGLNLLTGFCGQISIGHMAFVGIGAYASAYLTSKLGFPFWTGLFCSGIIAGFIGLLFGLPSLRVKGLYLALSTLAAQFIISYLFLQWRSVTGGPNGIEVVPAQFFGYVIETKAQSYYLTLTVCVLMMALVLNLMRSDLGRCFIAVRDNDIAAEAIGINVYLCKLTAFVIGCFYAGVAGSIWAHYMTFVNVDYFNLMDSLWYLGILIIGGLGSFVGPILGVIFIKGLNEILTVFIAPAVARAFPALELQIPASISIIFFAVCIIIFLRFEPRGLAHSWTNFRDYYRLWPFPY